MTALDALISRARSVPIKQVIMQRGIKLKRSGAEYIGPCPKCGGRDRFAINVKKGLWNCRGCNVGGDIIDLIRHLDDVDTVTACTTLVGEPPRKANGKDRDDLKKVVVAEFTYETENGDTAFVVERIQFQNDDGSFDLKDGKPDKAHFGRNGPTQVGQELGCSTSTVRRLYPIGYPS
jgi:hypothetical protein